VSVSGAVRRALPEEVELIEGSASGVYHATGIRIRDLPITLDKLLQ
jgi:hypothetical protein